jgi:hypothetical protein
MRTLLRLLAALCCFVPAAFASAQDDGSVLPFPPTPSASKAGPTLQESNTVTINLEVGENASGVLYALGGASGGLSCSMDQGHLCFECNMMIIERYLAKSAEEIPPGKHTIVV